MAVAALTLGILALLSCIIPPFFVVGVPLAVVGLVLGAIGRRGALARNEPLGSATGGLVLSVVALVLGLAWLTLFGNFLGKGAGDLKRLHRPTGAPAMLRSARLRPAGSRRGCAAGAPRRTWANEAGRESDCVPAS